MTPEVFFLLLLWSCYFLLIAYLFWWHREVETHPVSYQYCVELTLTVPPGVIGTPDELHAFAQTVGQAVRQEIEAIP